MEIVVANVWVVVLGYGDVSDIGVFDVFDVFGGILFNVFVVLKVLVSDDGIVCLCDIACGEIVREARIGLRDGEVVVLFNDGEEFVVCVFDVIDGLFVLCEIFVRFVFCDYVDYL